MSRLQNGDRAVQVSFEKVQNQSSKRTAAKLMHTVCEVLRLVHKQGATPALDATAQDNTPWLFQATLLDDIRIAKALQCHSARWILDDGFFGLCPPN